MERVRLGFIGCGGVAQQHFKGIQTLDAAEMAAFCDVRLDAAQSAAETYGGQAFGSHDEMLQACDLDAVYVILPPFAHGDAEHAVIQRNLPFFVEKPVGLDLGACREIAAEVEKRGLLTSAGYMTRYRNSVQAARQVLSEDPAVLAQGGWIGAAPKMTQPIHSWWVAREKSGGQLVEQTTHTVDLALYLMGEPVEVYATAARGFVQGVERYTNDDASVANIRFRSGAVAAIYSACCADAGGGGVSLSLYSRRHTVLFKEWNHSVKILGVDQEPVEIAGEPDIFKIEDSAFIEAVRTRDTSRVLCSYRDGLRATEVTLAASRSMETGQPVPLA